jgi:hypothetical protein
MAYASLYIESDRRGCEKNAKNRISLLRHNITTAVKCDTTPARGHYTGVQLS